MILKFALVYAVSFIFNILINKYGLKLIPECDVRLTLDSKASGDSLDLFSIKGHKFLAFFLATLVSAVINFLGQKFLVFKQAKLDPKDETQIEVS